MTTKDREGPPAEEPLAELERRLIAEYVAATGHDYHELVTRDDEEARRILTDASRHATSKLAEVESRSHYLKKLHGEE